MRSRLEDRLEELKKEYQKGEERLTALNNETSELGKTMLRISGAIQVLGELLGYSEVSSSPNVNGVKVPIKGNSVTLENQED
jgi:predicted nuclease with TOPRIM domain